MSRRHKRTQLNTRMETFLYYAKFVTLIIVSVLFVIAYSFSYREFPSSTAYHEFADHSDEINVSETQYPEIHMLIIMDYKDSYQNGSYENFSLIKPLVGNIPNVDFDLVLLDEPSGQTVLSNSGSGLLARLYHNKDYSYIVALGENAADAASEIHSLFYPASEVLLYGMSNEQICSNAGHTYPDSAYINAALSAARTLNPEADTMLFLCDDSNDSNAAAAIANKYINQYDDLTSIIVYSDEKNLREASSYITENLENLAVFYVSFLGGDESALHSEIINTLQKNTGEIIYDLSPPANEQSPRNSVIFWLEQSTECPMGYLGITPENPTDANFEFIDFIVANLPESSGFINPDSEYGNPSSLIGRGLNNIGLENFPLTVSEQFSYCLDNSLIIPKDKLQPGDLIFISAADGVFPENIADIAVYMNEDTVMAADSSGKLCFTKMLPDKYQAAYAHPFSLLDN